MLLHIQDFSYKYFLVLFNQLIYKYWLKIIKQIVKSVLKFCFQIGNKYENNKKIKVITIMGKQFLLQK